MRIAIGCSVTACLFGLVGAAAGADDASITAGGNQWILSTAAVQRVIALEGGRLLLKSFKNKITGRELVAAGTPSEELLVRVGDAKEPLTGATGPWNLVRAEQTTLRQGERRLDLVLKRGPLRVTKSYVVYPGSSIIRNYYASLLLPPDKTSDIPDIWNPNKYDKAIWRGLLCINFDMTGDTWDPAKLEGLRELIDIYHYLHEQGVVGRWVRVYRPPVTGDDPTMYFQRLSGDRRRGIIIPKRPAPGRVTVKPKGLLPAEAYTVTFHESAGAQKRAGAELMERGITLEKMAPGGKLTSPVGPYILYCRTIIGLQVTSNDANHEDLSSLALAFTV